jgi:amidohydrolase
MKMKPGDRDSGTGRQAQAAPGGPDTQMLKDMVEQNLPSLLTFYRDLHKNPELSFREKETSRKLAGALRELGFEVTTPVGRYPDPGLTCYGVVALLANGPGPTVLVRSDIDALPVEEKTGAPFASTVRMTGLGGEETPVMHACGHDMHTATLLGAARVLVALKDRWQGTLVVIGQPDEERGGGARAMLADGLYTRWPAPDFALAQHGDPAIDAGKVGFCPGYAMASIDMLDITIRGIGSHGARPNQGRDPIVVSAAVINALQTIVSRTIDPVETGVVTVGSIHGGNKHNIIPDKVELQLTVRSFTDSVRSQILDSIERITVNTARALDVPEDLLPVVHRRSEEFFPSLYNDPALVESCVQAMREILGEDNVLPVPRTTGGEDFSQLGRTKEKVPVFMFFVGTGDPAVDPKDRPSWHSPYYLPQTGPALRTGTLAMSSAVLKLMHR